MVFTKEQIKEANRLAMKIATSHSSQDDREQILTMYADIQIALFSFAETVKNDQH